MRVTTPVSAHVPVFALGTYAEAHRGVVLAAKKNRNLAVRRYVGAVLDAGLDDLCARGELAEPFVIVPAPTSLRNARLRGGDTVTAFCRATRRVVTPILYTARKSLDQHQLSASGRRRNLAGRIHLRGEVPQAPIVLIDDVVTTGSTFAAAVERLLAAGANVQAAVAIAAA
ncbi:phosphoribosyltransferase [Corynebacterium yudongzhengii]|uniref:ComF family protein n=2 Tax=Corynebacterium yudongzhengii TaxID=2080740 RepID=A0A2U1T775_9CORY|nr:ComF family protein [Corynebacterium yudongzhengii]AWB81399.1 phosphoribosyltransferase [Corynebacterium yudongzhengii]PWC01842.1 ComF family protein [Corynebacterium yudongzhengii]